MVLLGLGAMGGNGGEVFKGLDVNQLGTVRRLVGASPKMNPSYPL